MTNSYIDALRNSKTSNTKMILSPRRQIFENQGKRCYLCEKSMENVTCYFGIVEGPDMKTGLPSKDTRAICSSCYFSMGKNPVKQVRKTRDIEKEKEKEKKAKDEELNLFKELNLRKAKKYGYDEDDSDEDY